MRKTAKIVLTFPIFTPFKRDCILIQSHCQVVTVTAEERNTLRKVKGRLEYITVGVMFYVVTLVLVSEAVVTIEGTRK